jgi:hypothetical protein
VTARRLRALSRSAQGVSDPPVDIAWKNDPDPTMVGPAPIQPALEDFGLTEGAVKRLPRTFFDPEGWEPWTATNHNLFVIYVLALAVFFIAVYDRDLHISFAYLIGFLACGVVGIIPFGIFLALASPIEKRMRSALIPDYRKYLVYLSACDKYQLDKKSHDNEIANYNHRIEKRREIYWRSLSGVAFEMELAELFSLMGYEVTPTPSTGDGGVDLILRKDGTLTVVQCKAQAGRIPISVARELCASMVDFEADDAIIACFDGVTGPVAEYIETRRITVLDLNSILALRRQFA